MTTDDKSGERQSFKLLGVWKLQLFAVLFALIIVSSRVHVGGPAVLIPLMAIVLLFSGSNSRVEVDENELRVRAPLFWSKAIPLEEITSVREVNLISVWKRFWSIHWLTFSPIGHALLIDRQHPSMARPSFVLNVAEREAFLTLLASRRIPPTPPASPEQLAAT